MVKQKLVGYHSMIDYHTGRKWDSQLDKLHLNRPEKQENKLIIG